MRSKKKMPGGAFWITVPSLAIQALSLMACTSVAVTTANTTTPVLIGPVKRIGGTPYEKSAATAKPFDLDRSSSLFYLLYGSGSGTQRESSQRIVSSNEFDGELLESLDTTRDHARVKRIAIGSYSMLNILFGAYHKTWAGFEGVIEPRGEIK